MMMALRRRLGGGRQSPLFRLSMHRPQLRVITSEVSAAPASAPAPTPEADPDGQVPLEGPQPNLKRPPQLRIRKVLDKLSVQGHWNWRLATSTPNTSSVSPELGEATSEVFRDRNIRRKIVAEDARALSDALMSRTAGTWTAKDRIKSMEKGGFKPTADSKEEMQKPLPENVEVAGSLVYGDREAIAYVAHRMPFILGVMERVLAEIVLRFPNWNPNSILDFGSGPATAIWGCYNYWDLEDVATITAVEPSLAMSKMGREIIEAAETGFTVNWQKRLSTTNPAPHDLVISSCVLSEVGAEKQRRAVIRELWKHTKNFLVIVEPGTPVGFQFINEARDFLREKEEVHILAPCPHAQKCPMPKTSWCHFKHRVIKSKHHLQMVRSTRPYKDEKFSYIILQRKPVHAHANGDGHLEGLDEEEASPDATVSVEQLKEMPVVGDGALEEEFPEEHPSNCAAQWPRVVRAPMLKKGHVILDLCTPEGDLRRTIVTKAKPQREVYKRSRRLKWGDWWPGMGQGIGDLEDQTKK